VAVAGSEGDTEVQWNGMGRGGEHDEEVKDDGDNLTTEGS